MVIIADGTVRYAAPLDELYGSASARLRIRGRDPERLVRAFEEAGAQVDTDGHALEVTGLTPEDAGQLAFDAQVPLYELTADSPNLEQIFLDLVAWASPWSAACWCSSRATGSATFLFVGFATWVLFVEAVYGKMQEPLPFSAYLDAASGDLRKLLILAGWVLAAIAGAVFAIRRDLNSD